MPLSVLTPADRNPKLHELEQIKASIRDHGFVDLVIADERTGRLLGGHGRREALLNMLSAGEHMPEGLITDDDGGWLVPVSRGWSSRTDREAETVIIKLNRIGAAAGMHMPTFADMLQDLVTESPDLYDSLALADDELEEMLRVASADSLGEEPVIMAPVEEELAAAGDSLPGDSQFGRTVTCPDCGHDFDPSER
jgi:hypothetical protein